MERLHLRQHMFMESFLSKLCNALRLSMSGKQCVIQASHQCSSLRCHSQVATLARMQIHAVHNKASPKMSWRRTHLSEAHASVRPLAEQTLCADARRKEHPLHMHTWLPLAPWPSIDRRQRVSLPCISMPWLQATASNCGRTCACSLNASPTSG